MLRVREALGKFRSRPAPPPGAAHCPPRERWPSLSEIFCSACCPHPQGFPSGAWRLFPVLPAEPGPTAARHQVPSRGRQPCAPVGLEPRRRAGLRQMNGRARSGGDPGICSAANLPRSSVSGGPGAGGARRGSHGAEVLIRHGPAGRRGARAEILFSAFSCPAAASPECLSLSPPAPARLPRLATGLGTDAVPERTAPTGQGGPANPLARTSSRYLRSPHTPTLRTAAPGRLGAAATRDSL